MSNGMEQAYGNAKDGEMLLEDIALEVAKQYKLTEDQTAFLIEIADVEGRLKGMEFGVKKAKGKGVRKQAEWAAGSVRKNQNRYDKYKNTLATGGTDIKPVDFEEFYAYQGGPVGKGWAPIKDVPDAEAKLNKNWAPNMRQIWPKWKLNLAERRKQAEKK